MSTGCFSAVTAVSCFRCADGPASGGVGGARHAAARRRLRRSAKLPGALLRHGGIVNVAGQAASGGAGSGNNGSGFGSVGTNLGTLSSGAGPSSPNAKRGSVEARWASTSAAARYNPNRAVFIDSVDAAKEETSVSIEENHAECAPSTPPRSSSLFPPNVFRCRGTSIFSNPKSAAPGGACVAIPPLGDVARGAALSAARLGRSLVPRRLGCDGEQRRRG